MMHYGELRSLEARRAHACRQGGWIELNWKPWLNHTRTAAPTAAKVKNYHGGENARGCIFNGPAAPSSGIELIKQIMVKVDLNFNKLL